MARSLSVRFVAYIEAYNHLGEKVVVEIDGNQTVKELARNASHVGIELGNVYSDRLRRIPVRPDRIADVQNLLGIRLGEYKYAIVFAFKRK